MTTAGKELFLIRAHLAITAEVLLRLIRDKITTESALPLPMSGNLLSNGIRAIRKIYADRGQRKCMKIIMPISVIHHRLTAGNPERSASCSCLGFGSGCHSIATGCAHAKRSRFISVFHSKPEPDRSGAVECEDECEAKNAIRDNQRT